MLQFQSTSTSAPVPVYFDQCSSSCLLHPRTIPIGISLLQGFIFTGTYLLQGLIFIGTSLLQGLIFIGISLLQGLIFIHCLFISMAVSTLKYVVFFLCVCVRVFQLYFLFKCFFELLFLCFELHFQYNSKILSIFKEMSELIYNNLIFDW